jgi:SOS-response transcriptional repressor LexA
VKKLATEGKRRARLVAANPDYPDIPFADHEIVVWGVVTLCLHHV